MASESPSCFPDASHHHGSERLVEINMEKAFPELARNTAPKRNAIQTRNATNLWQAFFYADVAYRFDL